MAYTYLTPGEQLALIRPRLADFERRHYEQTINKNTTGVDQAGVDASIAQLDDAIAYLLHEQKTAEAAEKKAK